MTDIFDAGQYIEAFLKIRAKSGEIVPLKLNPAQKKLHAVLERQRAEGKPMRAIVLKARQLGFSTYTEARIFHRAATRENHRALVLAHRDDSTALLFSMFKLFLRELPAPLRPMVRRDNDGLIEFDNPSRRQKERDAQPGLRSLVTCSTAGSGGSGVGRGGTIESLHCSEYAFWRGDKQSTLLGVLQSVPAEAGTLVVIESTANGFEEFQKLWERAARGENDYAPVFSPWFEDEGYRKSVPPGTVWTEKELALKERHGLDDGQLAWRRWCIENNCGGDERLFRQEYPSSPEEAFLTTGTGVFDNEVVMACIEASPEPIDAGEFEYDYDGVRITNIRWASRPRGAIKLYAEPEQGRPYVLGGDTAGEGSDYFTGVLLDNVTGETAAVLRRQQDEVEYTRQMYCLGMWYGEALMGIEVNFTTYPQRELERLGYTRFYLRERYDTATHGVKLSYGFRTDGNTRPVIVSGLKRLMQESPERVKDADILREMLTFTVSDRGRAEASAGEHDDLVMALAIAHEIRPQQRYTRAVEPTAARAEWTDSMREDYARATRAERAMLLEKWGRDTG